jgi:hypothetical protein
MFTVMHSDVIRVQTYVPQDQVSGLQKGVGAIVRVPEMPGEFRGTVARVASALQRGTRTVLTEIDVPNHDTHEAIRGSDQMPLCKGIECSNHLNRLALGWFKGGSRNAKDIPRSHRRRRPVNVTC